MAFSLFLMVLVWPVYQHRALKGRRTLRGLALIVAVLLMLIATEAVLLALFPVMGIRLVPCRDLWPWIIVLDIAITAFAYGTMAISLGFTGAGIASVLGNSQLLLAVALDVWLLGEQLTRIRLVDLLLGLVGVVLVAFPATSEIAVEGRVDPLLALASSVGPVTASVVVKHVGPGVSRLILAAWPLVLSSVPLFLLSLALEPGHKITWSLQFVSLLLFLGIPGTAFLTLTWYWLLRHGDLGRLSLIFYAVPTVGFGFSWALYAEPITPRELGGIALILLSIAAIFSEEWRAGRN